MDRREMLAGAAMIPAYLGLPPGLCESEAVRQTPPPYDPVAVLEAMRERGHEVYVCCHGEWFAEFPGVHDSSTGYPGYQYSPAFPDFPSAVRWLHRQAAAVDPAFAEQWPVPE